MGEAISVTTCTTCGFGTYSLIENANECRACPDNSECPGGFEILAEPGYWRSSETSESVYSCFFPGACLGG